MNTIEKIHAEWRDEERAKIVANNGVVKLDIEARFFGKVNPSRGYYIVDPASGRWHLHHDGKVKEGVNADSDKPAFWDTEEEAALFLNEWKKRILSFDAV